MGTVGTCLVLSVYGTSTFQLIYSSSKTDNMCTECKKVLVAVSHTAVACNPLYGGLNLVATDFDQMTRSIDKIYSQEIWKLSS